MDQLDDNSSEILYALVSHDEYFNGGIKVSGQSNTKFTYNASLRGSVKASGISEVKLTYSVTSRGSIKASGRSSVNFIRGGVKISGQSELQSTNNNHFTGGIKLSGLSDVDLVLGGVKFSGESDVQLIYDVTRKDDEWDVIAVAGKNIPRQIHPHYGHCYFKWNGSQLYYKIYQTSPYTHNIYIHGPAGTYETTSSRVRIDGPYTNPIQGYISVGIDVIRSGQAYVQFDGGYYFRSQLIIPTIVGGSSTTSFEFLIVPEGGSSLSGASNQYALKSVEMQSGTQISGSADVSTILTPRILRAGLKPSGISVISRVSDENMHKGFSVSGESFTEFTYTPDLGGGILCDTTNIYSHYLAVAMSGELMLGGTAYEERIYWPRTDGSITVAGTLWPNFIDQVDGRVGLRMGGKSTIFYEKYYQSFRSGYGRAMASENIYTVVPQTNALITTDSSPTLEDCLPALISAGWCEVSEPRTNAIIPKILQKRMGKYLPPKQPVQRKVTSLTQKSTTRF